MIPIDGGVASRCAAFDPMRHMALRPLRDLLGILCAVLLCQDNPPLRTTGLPSEAISKSIVSSMNTSTVLRGHR